MLKGSLGYQRLCIVDLTFIGSDFWIGFWQVFVISEGIVL
jgi:hypothetical protein